MSLCFTAIEKSTMALWVVFKTKSLCLKMSTHLHIEMPSPTLICYILKGLNTVWHFWECVTYSQDNFLRGRLLTDKIHCHFCTHSQPSTAWSNILTIYRPQSQHTIIPQSQYNSIEALFKKQSIYHEIKPLSFTPVIYTIFAQVHAHTHTHTHTLCLH